MNDIDISIIIPMSNIGDKIKIVLNILSNEVKNLKAEFITVDMGSTDKTIFSALETINELSLNGKVIQCGKDQIGTALNYGLFKAHGKYITFIFPRNFYHDFLEDFFINAESNKYDFIFGSNDKIIKNENLLVNELSSDDLIKCLFYNNVKIDASAILISKDFIKKNNIYFDESCKVGYTEEFILKIINNNVNFYKSENIPKKEIIKDPSDNQATFGITCFDKINAMLRFKEEILNKKNLNEILIYEKIPQTILYCVDLLISEGYSVSSIKNALKFRNYEKYLISNQLTSKKTARKIFIWKYTPWLYKID